MIIVSDTTPLNYLILVGRAELLSNLFGNIIIPEAVFAEMSHERTPAAVLDWIKSLPLWVEVKTPSSAATESIKGLGKGETEAIALALEERADAVLMDDKKTLQSKTTRGESVTRASPLSEREKTLFALK